MATKTRGKILQRCLTDIFELSTPEFEDTAEYLAVLRYRTAGRRRVAKNFEKATQGIERRMAERSITPKGIERQIKNVRQNRERLSRCDT
ncbi:MAG: hypothetical protein AAB354_13310 [candidate division KSB1 bacterium]